MDPLKFIQNSAERLGKTRQGSVGAVEKIEGKRREK